jgi:hypothetical protein
VTNSMTSLHVDAAVDPGLALRRVAFLVMLLSAAVAGAVAATTATGYTAALFILPAYLLWIVVDLRVRMVRGFAFWFSLFVSLFPYWGLLVYLMISRRAVGILMWIAMVVAMWIPAGLAAFLARGLYCACTGERF